ncbi:MGDG synthase family glycosyltransferase [Oceanobacillus halotolerans]|uniref:MGDG synthase family glycosyltransferase n=1 Tax=Oceanobacillus halotolerans TaxID=2663380 RepID=UPI0013DCD5FA|nr:UDP-glucuronosyltransferase [Oceanobacillus halotolerans]
MSRTQAQQQDVLFLPFMQIPSGHHHVADALRAELQLYKKEIAYDKVDILSYSYGPMEKLITSLYLTSIKRLPNVYHWIYRFAAYQNRYGKRHYMYEVLFTYFFQRLLRTKDPRILFCTHCLPSYMASVLKQKGKLDAIVVNVYTDYFVNQVWGLQYIDYHFVPSKLVKDFLISQGVEESRIFVTGIPIHPAFHDRLPTTTKANETITVLVTGGNLGIGSMENLVKDTSGKVHYYVLCGKNEALYERLLKEQRDHVTPFSYISSRQEMNQLYDQVDAVLTKPGGVTISECLWKKKPTFVYNPLPGQERINVEQLQKLGVILPCEDRVEQQILDFFADEDQQNYVNEQLDRYHHDLENENLSTTLSTIMKECIKH